MVIDHCDLDGSIGSNICLLNFTKNTDELPGRFAVLNVLTSSFLEHLQSLVLENHQPTLVWCCIPIHRL